MNRYRLQIATPDIVKYFDDLENRVLKLKQLRLILSQHRKFWRVAQSTSTVEFIAFLSEHTKLHRIEFPFPQREETLYVWGNVPLYTALMGLRKNVYFSHYTAMRIHGLTEQTPTAIYLTDERSQGTPRAQAKLTQHDIDQAFAKRSRESQNAVVHDKRKIYLLNSAHTRQQGVVTTRINDDDGEDVEVRVTDLERTLIDITVRPFYAGGIYEIAKAFELAKDIVSVNRLITTLLKMEFAYPYHQAIGYYLERAQYKPMLLDLVRRLPMECDFYLTHDMGTNTRYVSDWRLFVPDGF